jgi:hypothetical protein
MFKSRLVKLLLSILILSIIILPLGCGKGPTLPAGVTLTPGNGYVTITWSPVVGATSYNIYSNANSSVTKDNAGDKIIGASSPYTQTKLNNGTTYYFIITAVNSGGESYPSSQQSITPIDFTSGKYRIITKADCLSCSISQALSLGNMSANFTGTVKVAANHFKCIDKTGKEREIELISTDPAEEVIHEDGKIAINTKEFGTIYRNNEIDNTDTYWMPDSQIKKLKTYLGFK